MTSLAERGRRHQWLGAGFDESYYDADPIVVCGGEGAYLVDASGRRYLDALCVQSAGLLGHNHPRVVEAMREQLSRMTTNVGGMLPSDRSIELSERLAGLSDGALTRAFFMLSGSDANDAAIQAARQFQKLAGRGTKYKAIVRRHGYHGSTLATSAASGSNRYPHSALEPLPSGFVHVESPYPHACRMCGDACTLDCAGEVERALTYEDPDTVACVLVEPTMAAAGIVPPPPGYLRRLREICDAHDILLIVDEVVTAMGRTGTWFEYQREGAVPDIVILAKVLTAGHMPLGALLVREHVAAAFQGSPDRTFSGGTTLGGMPLACAAALAAIETVVDEDLLTAASRIEQLSLPRLCELQERSRIVAEVRTRGAMGAIEWVADRETGRPFADVEAVKSRAVAIGREHGVHFFGGPAQTLIWIPPSDIDSRVLDHLLSAVEATVGAIEREFGARLPRIHQHFARRGEE
ncbi:MAG TPA: aminotransferase class III-fold pyridoxal phosphate-dependent enzyme [Conexibacter sp.]|jgi:adenosylmethionine-8-amino-7-oxononanoate aminotransferase|nr:aminotransferase class III-fold pyridoxal phosphate-dependent enzyme [Conexibacter sp.]